MFAASRARKMKGKPTPTDIYDIINSVVAQHTARKPLILLSFAAVVGGAQSCSEGAQSAVLESATKRGRCK